GLELGPPELAPVAAPARARPDAGTRRRVAPQLLRSDRKRPGESRGASHFRSRRPDSNRRHRHYKCRALPAELLRRCIARVSAANPGVRPFEGSPNKSRSRKAYAEAD